MPLQTSTARLTTPVPETSKEPAAWYGSTDPESLRRELERLQVELEHREHEIRQYERILGMMTTSTSWRITSPLRGAKDRFRKLRAPALRRFEQASVTGAAIARHRAAAERKALRNSGLFDAQWYVRQAPRGIGADPLDHYLTVGWRHGLSPSALFDAPWYTATYLGSVDREPLSDFVTRGVWLGASPNRFFDVSLWAAHESDGMSPLRYLRGVAASLRDVRASDPNGSSIVEVHIGGQNLRSGAATCIYAHYDPGSTVDAYVLNALEGLAAAGLQTIFLSSCRSLDSASRERLRPLTTHIITTSNLGRDWGLYHEGIRFARERSEPTSLTLLNDSVYIIASSLQSLFDRVASSGLDIAGATDSFQQRYHLQSYFLHFNKDALDSGLIDEWLASYVPVADKTYIINAYEIGVSRRAEELRLQVGAVWPYVWLRDSVAHALAPRTFPGLRSGAMSLNPTHFYWDTLVRQGCPFLKVELLRENPEDLADVEDFEEILTRLGASASVSDIKSHLERVRDGG
jgi:rhamnosyltransferase